MTGIHPNFKSLPVEVLHQIFQLLPAEESYNFSLVCKSWLQPAQSVLYSKVKLRTMSELQKFQDTIEKDTILGTKIKEFILYPGLVYTTGDEKSAVFEAFNTLTTLLSKHLPNLEVLEDGASRSYIPTLETLLNSQLKHLRRMNPPSYTCRKTEIANYVTCALLMKNRLENIFISDETKYEDDTIHSGQFFFDRLYNQLHQFDNLEEIIIKRATEEEIKVIDHVLKVCTLLKNITFHFTHPTGDTNQNDNISIEEIPNFITKPNVKALTAPILAFNLKLLIYIMHTFTKLQKLKLAVCGPPLVFSINQHILVDFLYYLSRIDEFSASVSSIYPNVITEIFKSYWIATSNSGGKYVNCTYTEYDIVNKEVAVIRLSKESSSKHTNLAIEYAASNPSWEHVDFTEKNGKFIRELRFEFKLERSELKGKRNILPEDFMVHTFTHCPNLQDLCLVDCILKKVTPYSRVDFSKEVSLNVLSLYRCTIYFGVLEQFSFLIRRIKELRLEMNTFYIIKDDLPNTDFSSECKVVEINMPFTKIDSVVFSKYDLYENLCIKVFVSSERKYYYYRYEASDEDGYMQVSTEQEFSTESDDDHIYICCETIPTFRIKDKLE